MTTFSLINFGCRASQADGAALRTQLIEAGLAEAAGGRSDVAVINTCSVTAAADAEVRQTIRRLHRENAACKILVTGCYAQRAPKETAGLDGVAWVIGNSHKHEIAGILRAVAEASHAETQSGSDVFSGREADVRVGEIAPQFHFVPVAAGDRTRPTLKVQDGCNARCSFCIIPAVRGRSRSMEPARAIEQVRSLAGAGYREVVLSGINLGRYGRDLAPRVTFIDLVERILSETAVERIRISSIEVMDVSAALIRLVAHEPRIADHFHIPLQSGCDHTLRQMNRRYWAAQYAERVRSIRELMPHCGIGADVMTGFPGETGAHHSESARLIDSLPFTYLHVFPYSVRPSTRAAARTDQVNGRIAHERGAELRAIVARRREAFLRGQLGRTLSALTLAEAAEAGTRALSSNFLDVSLPGVRLPANRLVNVGVHRIHEGRLEGRTDPDILLDRV